MIGFTLVVACLKIIASSQGSVRSDAGVSVTATHVVRYVNENSSCEFPIEKGWVGDRSHIFINMQLYRHYVSTVAEITKNKFTVFPSSYMLYVTNVSTDTFVLMSVPMHFDGAKIYFMQKTRESDKRFTVKTVQNVLLQVVSTPSISCNCSSGFTKKVHVCQCLIQSRPIGNITADATPRCKILMETETEYKEVGHHLTTANVTFYCNDGNVTERRGSICILYDDPARRGICHVIQDMGLLPSSYGVAFYVIIATLVTLLILAVVFPLKALMCNSDSQKSDYSKGSSFSGKLIALFCSPEETQCITESERRSSGKKTSIKEVPTSRSPLLTQNNDDSQPREPYASINSSTLSIFQPEYESVKREKLNNSVFV